LVHHGTTDGEEDDYVKGNCFIIEGTMMGVRQWGNGIYYYLSAIMYLLKKGATYVIVPTTKNKQGKIMNPIGAINLESIAYGPNATLDFDESKCALVNPREIWAGSWGTMWDFMNFRNEWDEFTKDWPKVEKAFNQNPYIADFGIYPSMHNVTNNIGVDWENVVVLHIRQGDVMVQVNGPQKIFWHSQPPCAFYEDVIETGYKDGKPFPYVLIITNKIPGRHPNLINICDQYLEDRYASGEYATKLLDYNLISDRLLTKDSHAGNPEENVGLRKDLYILSEAINVAEGHSTFTMGTTIFNYNLKRHFYPSAPATINTVLPTKRTIDGLSVYTRQFYLPNVEQTLYILDGWLEFDASCNAYSKHMDQPIFTFMTNAQKLAKEKWGRRKTNYTQELLNYNRSLIVKYKTTNEPFHCDDISAATNNPSWFIPCICSSTSLNSTSITAQE